MVQVMKRWLDTGVDGFRLDAIPYLCERDGTNNENLPETHAVIRKLRAELDAYAKGKVLLAEANQWPEDVQDSTVSSWEWSAPPPVGIHPPRGSSRRGLEHPHPLRADVRLGRTITTSSPRRPNVAGEPPASIFDSPQAPTPTSGSSSTIGRRNGTP